MNAATPTGTRPRRRSDELAVVVLRCMHHLYACRFASPVGKARLPELPDPYDAAGVLNGLRAVDARPRSVRELASRWAREPRLLHAEALARVSLGRLGEERADLHRRVLTVPAALRRPLAILLDCIDIETAGPSQAALALSSESVELESEGLITRLELENRVLHAVVEAVADSLGDHPELSVVSAFACWVDVAERRVSMGELELRRCDRSAGWGAPMGYTTMPLWRAVRWNKDRRGSGLAPPRPSTTVTIIDERIQLVADLAAFVPTRVEPSCSASRGLHQVADHLGGSERERAERYRAWLDEYILWHEIGHRRTDPELAYHERKTTESIGAFHALERDLAEVLADAEAFAECLRPADGVRRALLRGVLHLHTWSMLDGVAAGTIAVELCHLCRLRALHQADPSDWLRRQAARMVRAAARSEDFEAGRAWRERECKGLARELSGGRW